MEVHTTRVITAVRARVFASWTDPDQLAQWRAPKGITNSVNRFESRP